MPPLCLVHLGRFLRLLVHYTRIYPNSSILELTQARRTDAVVFMAPVTSKALLEKALYVRRCLSECDDRMWT